MRRVGAASRAIGVDHGIDQPAANAINESDSMNDTQRFPLGEQACGESGEAETPYVAPSLSRAISPVTDGRLLAFAVKCATADM